MCHRLLILVVGMLQVVNLDGGCHRLLIFMVGVSQAVDLDSHGRSTNEKTQKSLKSNIHESFTLQKLKCILYFL